MEHFGNVKGVRGGQTALEPAQGEPRGWVSSRTSASVVVSASAGADVPGG